MLKILKRLLFYRSKYGQKDNKIDFFLKFFFIFCFILILVILLIKNFLIETQNFDSKLISDGFFKKERDVTVLAEDSIKYYIEHNIDQSSNFSEKEPYTILSRSVPLIVIFTIKFQKEQQQQDFLRKKQPYPYPVFMMPIFKIFPIYFIQSSGIKELKNIPPEIFHSFLVKPLRIKILKRSSTKNEFIAENYTSRSVIIKSQPPIFKTSLTPLSICRAQSEITERYTSTSMIMRSQPPIVQTSLNPLPNCKAQSEIIEEYTSTSMIVRSQPPIVRTSLNPLFTYKLQSEIIEGYTSTSMIMRSKPPIVRTFLNPLFTYKLQSEIIEGYVSKSVLKTLKARLPVFRAQLRLFNERGCCNERVCCSII